MCKFLEQALATDPVRDWAQLVVDVTQQLMAQRTEWKWINVAVCLEKKRSQPHPICCNNAVGQATAGSLLTHMSSEAPRIVAAVLRELTAQYTVNLVVIG